MATRRRTSAAAAPAARSADAPVEAPLTVQDRPRHTVPTAALDAGEQTARVRPLSFADIAALEERGGTIEGYTVQQHFEAEPAHLVPVTITADEPWHAWNRRGKPMRPMGEGGRVDPDQEPIGYALPVTVKNIFGSETGGTVYSTVEGERLVATETERWGRSIRDTLAVPAADDEDGIEMPLVKIYGASVNLTAFLRGIDAPDALARVEQALAQAFPDPENRLTLHKSQSRPVEDYRVNVVELDGTPLALDVLSAEASYYANRSAFRTEGIPPHVHRGTR